MKKEFSGDDLKRAVSFFQIVNSGDDRNYFVGVEDDGRGICVVLKKQGEVPAFGFLGQSGFVRDEAGKINDLRPVRGKGDKRDKKNSCEN